MLALLYAKGWYWHEGWKVLVIDSPAGQLTFHVPSDFNTYTLPVISPCWDGHTTEQKFERIEKYMTRNIIKSQVPLSGEPEMVQCINKKHVPQDIRIQRKDGSAVFWDEKGKPYVQCQHDANCFVPIPDDFLASIGGVVIKIDKGDKEYQSRHKAPEGKL